MVKPGTVANLTFTDDLLDIHVIEPPKDLEDLPHPHAPSRPLRPQRRYRSLPGHRSPRRHPRGLSPLSDCAP